MQDQLISSHLEMATSSDDLILWTLEIISSILLTESIDLSLNGHATVTMLQCYAIKVK